MDRDNDEAIDRLTNTNTSILYIYFSRNELYAWILRSFKALSKEDSDERFEDTDEDEDGFVSWNEYKNDEFDFGDGDIDMEDDEIEEA